MSWEDTLKSNKWGEKKDPHGRVEDWKFTLPKTLETQEDKKKKRYKAAREGFITGGENEQVVDDLMAEHEKKKRDN